MTTTNPYMARFVSSPAFVAPEMRAQFETNLHMLATLFDEPKARAEAQAIDNFWPSDPTSFLAQVRPYVVTEGILQIPVQGVLLNDFPYCLPWATGYDYIWQAYSRGMADSAVQGIAIVSNSPGGDVSGNFDLVDKMYALRDQKPVRAYADDYAYSAAYSIASVGKITVNRTGGVGSIGVVVGHMDVSEAMKQDGLKMTFIFAGAHKVDGNAYEPLPAAVKARIQARIDALYDVFVATVARNRGMDERAVRDTEALTFTAQEAVANGLADSIGSLDDAVAAFAADLNQQEGEVDMSNPDTTAVAQAAHEAAVTAARTEGHAAGRAEGHAAGLKEGATAERTRVSAILASDEGKARPGAAMTTAMKTGMSLEDARAFLADLPAEAAKAESPAAVAVDALAAAMAATGGGAGVGADAKPSAADPNSAEGVMAAVAAMGLPGFRKAS